MSVSHNVYSLLTLLSQSVSLYACLSFNRSVNKLVTPCQSVGLSVGQSAYQSVDQSVSLLVTSKTTVSQSVRPPDSLWFSQLVNQPTNTSVSLPMPVGQLISESIGWSVSHSTCWSANQ